jgi:uncharacterized repeat protein (TIGR01451 family)
MTDTLPDGVLFVSASVNNGSNCNLTNSTLICDIGSISNGNSVAVSIVVAPTASGIVDTSIDIVNSGVVTFNEIEIDPSNNTATATTTVILAADLMVTKTDSADPIQVGDTFIYTVTVANNGPSRATGVVLTDTLPPNMTVGSVVSTQGSCAEVSGNVTCNLGDLDNGGSAVVTITVTLVSAIGGQTINNAVSVASRVGDPDATNNIATQSTTIATPSQADVSVSVVDSVDPVFVAKPLAYTVTVVNNGPVTAPNTVMTSKLSSDVNFVSALASRGSCKEASGTVTCDLGLMNSGASAIVTINVVPTAGAGGTTITNTVNVFSGASDPINANNTATESTNVTSNADLSVTMSDSPDPAPVGETLTYTLVVTNGGPSRATDVVVTDTLPGNVVFGLALPNHGFCTNNATSVTCKIGHLDANDSVDINITVTLSTVASTTITNTATVQSNVDDLVTVNNNVTQETTIFPNADLSVTNVGPANGVITGRQLVYRVAVVNKGPSVATGVTLVDTLPDGVTFASSTPSQGTCVESSGR